MKIKTTELSGKALDWAVAHVEGFTLTTDGISRLLQRGQEMFRVLGPGASHLNYSPSTDWDQGGPIIDRMFSQGLRLHTAEFVTGVHDKKLIAASLDAPNGFYFGPTPLIAAMRCFVASKLGDEVDVPEGLA